MIKNILFCFILFLSACSSAKDAFTLKKKNSSDEFLVEKKSPLVMPPNFEELPRPLAEELSDDINNSELNINEVEKLLLNKSASSEEKNSSQPSSIEKSILEKIN